MIAFVIPKKIHFCYGLAPDFGGKPFSFVHWAAVHSASLFHPDWEINFWYEHKPEGYYLEHIEHLIRPRQIKAPDNIFGQPLLHVAHKSDVLRLRILIEEGGFFLDMDTITVGSLESLRGNRFVIGEETTDEYGFEGLCNAVMGAEAGSQFARAWLDTYKTFRSQGRDQYWNEHSVVIPAKLSQSLCEHITILPPDRFLKPDWTPSGIEELFVSKRAYPNALVHHLWEQASWDLLGQIDEHNVFERAESTYTSLVIKILKERVDDLLRRSH